MRREIRPIFFVTHFSSSRQSWNDLRRHLVATGRGTLAHYFFLNVVTPTASILGTGEYHIGLGSTISLVCVIDNNSVPECANHTTVTSRKSAIGKFQSKLAGNNEFYMEKHLKNTIKQPNKIKLAVKFGALARPPPLKR
ncbi:unnamed protein product, partial [Nesidiocoris tenuis]